MADLTFQIQPSRMHIFVQGCDGAEESDQSTIISDQIRSREGRSLGLPPVNGIGTDSSFSSKWGGEVDAVAQPSLPLPLF